MTRRASRRIKIDVTDLSKTAVAVLTLMSTDGSDSIDVQISFNPAPSEPISEDTVENLPAAHLAMVKLINLADASGFVISADAEGEPATEAKVH
jgi:hypothetical protein